MEGVEDIPGTALYEGIEWGEWETVPEYLHYIAGREYAMDIGTQIPHSAVRNYVMEPRALTHEDATADDLAKMAYIVEQGLKLDRIIPIPALAEAGQTVCNGRPNPDSMVIGLSSSGGH
jgi:N-acyl-D-aspartate/D-glutamate deacylase